MRQDKARQLRLAAPRHHSAWQAASMTLNAWKQAATMSLTSSAMTLDEAVLGVPGTPGLYAIHGTSEVWLELGATHRPDVPLYVGKSNSSLTAREVRGHFAGDPARPARTGSSTVRRSFAALLSSTLRMTAQPRNLDEPGNFSNYALDVAGDARLTSWMREHLRLAVWLKPDAVGLVELEDIETALIRAWAPPINISRNPRKWPELRAARGRMTAAARAWSAT